MIKCLLTELGRAGRENIWPSVMAHGPRCARFVRHDLGPNIFPSGPPTQSISTYSHAGKEQNEPICNPLHEKRPLQELSGSVCFLACKAGVFFFW